MPKLTNEPAIIVQFGYKIKSYYKDFAENGVEISGGEAQRVSVARAFLHRSDILLMDEPFSSLDIKLKKQITELFFELWNADKRTVLAVTHDVDGAVYMAQRILVLSKGKIVYDVKPQTPVPRDIKTSYKIRESVLENLLI